MDTTILEEIGLSKAEIKTYTALLHLGLTTAGKLAREIDFRKSTVYDCLHRLKEKGLVSSVILKGVSSFQAASPEKLIQFFDERKRKIDQSGEKLQTLLEELQEIHHFSKPAAEAHVFYGIEGFKTIRRDILHSKSKELLILGAIFREDKVMPAFFEQWNKERIKQKIKLKILAKQKTTDTIMKKTKDTEIRFLPDTVHNPVVINVYGDHVVSLVWKEKYPLCFMIINKEIADAYRTYFDLLWKMTK